MIDAPRIMLAAPASGTGKTMITCGLLQALVNCGLKPAALKCGPDYIDPMFHRRVTGAPGGNLDLFFTEEEVLRQLLARAVQGCDIAVLEGVMGYYDGYGETGGAGSSYEIARATQTPVVLVVNARGASLSLAALVKGFSEFAPDANIAGVILNRCSTAMRDHLAPVIERASGVPVVGCVPVDERFAVESRHLGLVTAGEIADLRERVAALAETLAQTVDIDRLRAIAQAALPVSAQPFFTPRAVSEDETVTLAVARDEAFCFYYSENLRMLEDLGVTLAPFSPLADEALPDGACGLYLGGGYPELHARELAENEPMRRAIARAVAAGMPTVAECGGFMYLQRSLEDEAGRTWPMVGALPGENRNEGRLKQFGYVEIVSRVDNLYCSAGEKLRAHEFHYWHSSEGGADFTARKPGRTREWPCMVAGETLAAGFPHVYFPAHPQAAVRFTEAMVEYKKKDSHE